jgi:PAS domain S-box-containing protein
MPDNRKECAELQKKIKSLRLRVAELEKDSRTEAAPPKSDLLYQTLIENIHLGITLIDTEHRIVTTNVGMGKFFRKPHSEFVGKHCFREFEKRNAICSHCPGTRTMATGRPAEVQTEGVRDDGSRLLAHLRTFPVFKSDGSISGFIEIVEDITEYKRTEESLKESEQRFKTIFDNAADGILLADVETKKFYIGNKAICQMLGYKPEEIKNLTIWDIHPKEYLSFVSRDFEKRTRKEIMTTEDIPVKRKDGRVFYVDINTFPITLGGRTYLTGIFRDVTEHRQAEEKLKESEQRFKAIFDNAPVGILLADTETKKFYLGNKVICRMLGYKPEEIKNLTVLDIHPKEHLSYVMSDFERQARREITGTEDVPVKRKDGSVFYADISSFPMTFGGKTYLMGIFRDITARKKTEEALRGSEERFRSLAETTSDWIWEVDTNGIYTYVSPKVKDLLGYEPDEVIGKTPFDLMIPNEAKNVSEKFRAIVESRRPFTGLENTNLRKDGRYVVLETSGVPFFDPSGNLLGYRGIDRDITERRKAEEELNIYREKMVQAERLASLGTLSATIAHELNQPLTVIRLSIENSLDDLKSASCPKEVLDTLRDGLNEVSNAASVVDRFRNYARQSSRKNLCETDLGAIADRIIKLLGKTAQRTKMTLHLKGMDKLPPVYSNEKDVEQLFFALTENAIQAAGGKKSRRLIIEGDVKGENIELRFSDNCCGIAPENLDKIFDPFFTTGSDDGRTGLGLPIVQRIVSGYGGKIRVQSRPGKGTTFYVTLPIHSETVE